jgi:hypothetical protein
MSTDKAVPQRSEKTAMAFLVAEAVFGKSGVTMVLFHDTMKALLLKPASKCAIRPDLARIQATMAENGAELSLQQIKDTFISYCNVLKEKNGDRIVAMEIEQSDTMLVVTFTVRLFDPNSLLVIDEELAREPLLGDGSNWVKAK